jgi:dienelactone hydrolase
MRKTALMFAAHGYVAASVVYFGESGAHLHAHRHQFADAMISYPEAGHLFLNAESGPGSAMNRIQTASFEMVFGGTPEGDARAAADAWPRIHAFLAAALK